MSSSSGGAEPDHGKAGHVELKLEDRLNRGTPNRGYAQAGPRKHIAILGLDPVVDRDHELPGEQRVDEPSGRPERRQKSGDEDVGVQNPDGRFAPFTLRVRFAPLTHLQRCGCAGAAPP